MESSHLNLESTSSAPVKKAIVVEATKSRHPDASLGIWVLLIWISLVTCEKVVAQDWEKVGLGRLRTLMGSQLETGQGVSVSLVEADIDGGPGRSFLPDPGNSQFQGKSLINGSGSPEGISTHATQVGSVFFGRTASATPGIITATTFEAEDFVFYRSGYNDSINPLANPFAVQNHSYVGSGLSTAVASELLARHDFMVRRDRQTAVVGVNNGSGSNLPQLMVQGYNSISVGLSSGQHSSGLTTLPVAGRTKPDMVAPAGATSLAAPMVASSAALLHAKAIAMSADSAFHPEVIKSVLMAGANHDPFPSWSQTTARPLDAVFGAGQLDIYNSYHILQSGSHEGSLTEPVQSAPSRGWSYGEIVSAGQERYWDLQVTSQMPNAKATISLNWLARYESPTGDFANSLSISNMRLSLYRSTNGFLGSRIAQSDSAVDNVEHLFLENLETGRYTIGVWSDRPDVFGIAWDFQAVPEPGSLLLVILSSGFGGAWIRRRADGFIGRMPPPRPLHRDRWEG